MILVMVWFDGKVHNLASLVRENCAAALCANSSSQSHFPVVDPRCNKEDIASSLRDHNKSASNFLSKHFSIVQYMLVPSLLSTKGIMALL